MQKINVLPKHIADLIAAGEVVERPASVVKELMENAIDAGAKNITVEIKRGGITYIRITDDGCGIYREDITNAFKSHATSKITTADDLSAIGTLGFRGEALASVAAVSKVDVLTRTADEEIGTVYKIEGSEEKLLDDAGCPLGTTIVVKDLFYNTPARMKFLKKDVTEGNAVAGVVDRIALSHPEISVRFIRDDRQQLVTPGSGKLESCVYAVFGKDFAGGLVSTEYTLDGITVCGLVSLPRASRANRSMQFFFLNGRLVKSVTACAALEQAYKNSIMTGKFPACVLNITAPLEGVDVNVHPAKTEVRFENEKRIFDAVYYAVKNAIEEKDKPSKLDLAKIGLKQQNRFAKTEGEQIAFSKNPDFWSNKLPDEYKKTVSKSADELPKKPADTGAPKAYIRSSERASMANPERADGISEKTTVHKDVAREIEPLGAKREIESREIKRELISQVATEESKLEESIKEPSGQEAIKELEFQEAEKEPAPLEVPEFKVIGQAFSTYIIVEQDGKILLIDKHAAHERMMFEQLRIENSEIKSQMLLTPLVVTLSKEEYSAILQNKDVISATGFDIDDFGDGCVVVRECPSILIGEDLKALVEEMAGYLLTSNLPVPEKIDWIFHNTACRAAIKAGDKTTDYELQKFVEKLLKNPSIRYCPHGRPVLIEISESNIKKQFGRLM